MTKEKLIYYCVPSTHSISGGIAVILQHVKRLRERGWNIRMVTESGKKECKWFPGGDELAKLEIGLTEYPQYKENSKDPIVDLVIATSNTTAHTLFELPAKQKAYFVQSDESRFYPGSPSASYKAWQSYLYPYHCFTEAKWIIKWLEDNFGHKNVGYVPNGLDLNILQPDRKPLDPRDPNKLRVLIEGPISIDFKGVILAVQAVEPLAKEGLCEIWVVSSHATPNPSFNVARAFEGVPMDKMSEIYNSCDIFIKPSFVEGLAGPPMEAMKSGLAVITTNCTGVEDYAKHEENCLIVDLKGKTILTVDKNVFTEDIRQAVLRLIKDKDLRNKLIEQGKKDMETWTWERSIDMLENVLTDILNRDYKQDPEEKSKPPFIF